MTAPITFRWSGEAMEPLPRFAKMADREYVIGETYTLAPVEERSEVSHRHEFAWLKEAWENLPENIADLYPTAEHLRKRALILGGFCTETLVDCGTNAAALRVAAFAKAEDEFAWVVVRKHIVAVRKAKSQSHRAMDKHEFQRSKTAIMEVIAGMIGVTPAELAGARAA